MERNDCLKYSHTAKFLGADDNKNISIGFIEHKLVELIV